MAHLATATATPVIHQAPVGGLGYYPGGPPPPHGLIGAEHGTSFVALHSNLYPGGPEPPHGLLGATAPHPGAPNPVTHSIQPTNPWSGSIDGNVNPHGGCINGGVHYQPNPNLDISANGGSCFNGHGTVNPNAGASITWHFGGGPPPY